MLTPISVTAVFVTVIYVNSLKMEISLKVHLPRKNTTLIFHLTVTVFV